MQDVDLSLPDPPDDETQQAHDKAQLRDACLRVLGSNFDAVQIIATRHDAEAGTLSASWGEGNYYSRVGSVREWLRHQR